MSVSEQLAVFVEHYCITHPKLTTAFDPQWRSPCEIGEPFSTQSSEQLIQWQPLARSGADDLAPLSRALEVDIHPDIRDYYGAFWSGNLEAEAPDGHVSLIQLWNPDDIDRLNENLIGHAFAQRQSKSPLSIFFACTEPDSELFLTVRNDTGEVQLEKPGHKPLRTVAGSLSEMLERLVPASVTIPA